MSGSHYLLVDVTSPLHSKPFDVGLPIASSSVVVQEKPFDSADQAKIQRPEEQVECMRTRKGQP